MYLTVWRFVSTLHNTVQSVTEYHILVLFHQWQKIYSTDCFIGHSYKCWGNKDWPYPLTTKSLHDHMCTTLNHESMAVVWLYKCWVFINYVFLLMYHSCLKFRSKLTNVNDTFWRKFFASIILYFLYDHVSM